MSLLGNLLWIFLGGGLFLFLEYVLGGIVLCVTIVGIPFGVQCIKLSLLALTPFGRRVHDSHAASGCLAVVMNVLWIISGGIALVVTHIVFAVLCAVTIVGIPFARQHMKLAALALTPFGKTVE